MRPTHVAIPITNICQAAACASASPGMSQLSWFANLNQAIMQRLGFGPGSLTGRAWRFGYEGGGREHEVAINYLLNGSITFRMVYSYFLQTGAIVSVTDGFSEFNYQTNAIFWNPTDANAHERGINSTALSLSHEIGHAIGYFNDPASYVRNIEFPYDADRGVYTLSREEVRNLPFEQNIARELGEPVTQEYFGATGFRVNTVVFSCFSGSPGCN